MESDMKIEHSYSHKNGKLESDRFLITKKIISDSAVESLFGSVLTLSREEMIYLKGLLNDYQIPDEPKDFN